MGTPNLRKNFGEPRLTSAIPLTVFLTGLAFCGVIWLMNIYFMATSGIAQLHHLIAKRHALLSYTEWTTSIFVGFCLLAIPLFFSRKKIYSAALIVSCLSIATNTALLQASARIAQADYIQSMERNMAAIANGADFYYLEDVWAGPEQGANYLPRLKKHYSLVAEQWREIEDPTFEPIGNAYWSESDMTAFDGRGYTCWRIQGETYDLATTPTTLFFSPEGRAVGVLTDGTHLFGFANPEVANTNDYYSGQIIFTFDIELYSLDYSAIKTNGVLKAADNAWGGTIRRYKPRI